MRILGVLIPFSNKFINLPARQTGNYFRRFRVNNTNNFFDRPYSSTKEELDPQQIEGWKGSTKCSKVAWQVRAESFSSKANHSKKVQLQ